MAIAFVQETHNDASSSSSFTVTLTVAGGNYLVVSVAMLSDTGVTSTVSDSLGNTFARVLRQGSGGGGDHLEVWTAPVTTGGADTVTVSFSPVGITAAASVTEWSGVATSNPGQTSSSGSGTSTSPTSGSVSISSPGTTLVGALLCPGGVVVTDGGTNRVNVGFNTGFSQLDVEGYGGLSASQAATWTLDSSGGWAAAGVTIMPSGTTFGIEDDSLTVSPVVTW